MQSEQYQTCYFLGKSVAYVQIPMTFSFPFGQHEEKNITGSVATYTFGYLDSFKKLCHFLNKDSPQSSKTSLFFFSHSNVKKKNPAWFLFVWTEISKSEFTTPYISHIIK